MEAATKFLFDDDFAKGKEVRPPEPTITLAEHQRKLAAAEAESYNKGLVSAEAKAKSDAERNIGMALEALSRDLAGIEARLETEAVEVAIAVARKLATELAAREPFAEIAALTSECFRHMKTTPHLVVRLNEALYERACEELGALAKAHGFDGRLVVLAAPELAPSDCRIEWADGGIDRDGSKIDAAIAEAVERYISARNAAAD